MAGRPPKPGRFSQPNFLGIEEALASVPFPIHKRELMQEVDGRSVLVEGQNRDLRELVRDLNDDYFDNEEELHLSLERAFKDAFNGDLGDEHAPAQTTQAWQDPGLGKDHGTADFSAYGDVHSGESPR